MNPKLEAIFSRRSIRKYTDEKVSDEMIRDLLEAAMAAPSAIALDPWKFIVITDKNKLKATADVLDHGKMIADAPLGIIVCGDQKQAAAEALSYMIQDCSAAVENILIAANLLGLGAVWLGVHPRENRVEGLREVFNIPENITPLAAISIGHPDQNAAPRTRYDESKVHRNNW